MYHKFRGVSRRRPRRRAPHAHDRLSWSHALLQALWIETFCINPQPRGIGYYDSAIENSILGALSESLGPGGKAFLEYYPDNETSCGRLTMGFPPVLARQGYRLLEYGFTWSNDWYFSEGGHERAREKHMLGIQAEATAFLERWQFAEEAIGDIRDGTRNGVYVRRALESAEEVLRRSGVFPSRAVSEVAITSRAFIP